ncbi:MAG: diacylglycerol kinase, partial [Lachnospiraceae bacterium]|nr:diacylglycerol kinase [Lachnospiraceae bacterium]
MKNKTFREAVCCAVRGLIYAFKTERNFLRYLVIAAVFLAANLGLRVPLLAHIIYIVTICVTFAFEVVNTAIEHICDSFSGEVRPDIRLIKDLAAGAVLMSSLSFFISEIIFLTIQIVQLVQGG